MISDMEFLRSGFSIPRKIKALKVARLIDEEIFTKLRIDYRKMSNSDLEYAFSGKIKMILDQVYPKLQNLSQHFWTKSLKEPIEIEETLAALALNFLQKLNTTKHLGKILHKFYLSKNVRLIDIFIRILYSKELQSFNISAFLLFSDFKYIQSMETELLLFTQKVSETNNFISHYDEFKSFLFKNHLFVDYFNQLRSRNSLETFENIIDDVLQNVTLIDEGSFSMYDVDVFTTYDLKIYLKMFETGNPILDKGATFYVLLHELCHLFRRTSCNTWEESREAKTPETSIGEVSLSEAGDIIEVYFFNKRHNFLNLNTCNFLLSADGSMNQEEFREKFASLNEKQDSVYVKLKRGTQPNYSRDNPTEVIMRGCAFRKYRNMN